MKIRPTENRILIRIHRHSQHSEGGIYIGTPTTTFVRDADKAEQVTVGEVIAVGPGKRNKRGHRIPVEAAPGQFVTFSDTCGRPVDDDHLMIREDDIAGFLDKPTDAEVIYR